MSDGTAAAAPAAPVYPQTWSERTAGWQWALPLAGAMLAADHATKWWAIEALRPHDFTIPVITIIPGFLDLRYAENTGAAFSMLDGQVALLGGVSIIASLVIIWFWLTLPARETWGRAALALIFSGAVGNLIDRVFRGFVVDFIDAYIGASHWPTFNIADSCICIGAGILAVRFIKGKI